MEKAGRVSGPEPPKEIAASVERWYEAWAAERWLADGVIEDGVRLTECKDLTGWGTDYGGRWVTWGGCRVTDPQELRNEAAEQLERIEVRSDWKAIGNGKLDREHLRAVPFEEGQQWGATTHVHAHLDSTGKVRWAGLRTFGSEEDPTPPAEASVDVEQSGRTEQAVEWLACAAAGERCEREGRAGFGSSGRDRPWDAFAIGEVASGRIEEAHERWTAEDWRRGAARENGWPLVRHEHLQALEEGAAGRSVRWNGRRIGEMPEADGRWQLPEGIGKPVFRWPWAERDGNGKRETATANEILVPMDETTFVRGELKDGTVVQAWLEIRSGDGESAARLEIGGTAAWIATRSLEGDE